VATIRIALGPETLVAPNLRELSPAFVRRVAGHAQRDRRGGFQGMLDTVRDELPVLASALLELAA
jgi:hypothetical protein